MHFKKVERHNKYTRLLLSLLEMIKRIKLLGSLNKYKILITSESRKILITLIITLIAFFVLYSIHFKARI